MRNIRKKCELEEKFPLLAIENGCIVSKDADITVAFSLELPELFTVTSPEYAAMHAAWHKAVKVLPVYSILHKQDWFIRESYRPELGKDDLSFLDRSYERHFNERPFLHHSVYLCLTKTTKQRMAQRSDFSTLCRGTLLPKEVRERDAVLKFLEAVDQFERIINDSGCMRLRRLSADEIAGTEDKRGLLDRLDTSVSIDEKDIAAFKELDKHGIELEVRKVASDRKVPVLQLIADKYKPVN